MNLLPHKVQKVSSFLETMMIVEKLAKKKSDLVRRFYDLLILLEERTELKLLVAFDEAKKTVMSKIYLLESIYSKSLIKQHIIETEHIPLEPRFKYCIVGITRFKEFTFSVEMREWLLKAGIDNVINEISFVNPDPFSEALNSGLLDAYNTGGNTVFSTFDLGIDFALRDKNVEKFFRNYAMQLSEQVSKSIQSSIKYELLQAIKNGDSIPDIRKNILELWNKPIDVVVPPKISPDGNIIRQGYSYQMSPKHWANTVARTEVNGAYNKGRLDGFKQSGVVDRVQFSTSPDERLCPICAILEGMVYTLEQAVGVIPQHPNCRCQWIPILTTEKFEDAKISAQEVLANQITMEQYFMDSGMNKERAMAFENSMKQELNIAATERLYFEEFKKAFSVGNEFDVELDIGKINNGMTVKGKILTKQDYKNYKYTDKYGKEKTVDYVKGDKIGNFYRTLQQENMGGGEYKLVVDHSSFFLDKPFQNKAIGKEFFKNEYNFYVKHGVGHVNIYANGDVGFYAWAKYGFDFDDKLTLRVFQRKFEEWTIKKAGVRVDASKFNHSWDFATFNKEINGVKITGKDFFFDTKSTWYGKLDMNSDATSRKILENYLSITR